MSSAPSHEQQVLLRALTNKRAHVLGALEGLAEHDLRRPVLPSGWTCLGLVNHLSFDVELFWFQAVVAGEQPVVEEILASTANAWEVSADEPAAAVLERYRQDVERADEILAGRSLNAAPEWWPDFFGSWRLDTLREIVLHVIVETATHAGHLDAARELIDGKQHLVLTD